ncbi:MAG: 50S ribosomal protein L18 [Candidatus Peregrinibacteria bacterium]
MPTKKGIQKARRHTRIRSKVTGTSERPRLVIFRSLQHIYAQLVNDKDGKVLLSSSDIKEKGKGTKSEKAKNVGLDLAKKAKDKKITEVVFDRNGYKYHGRAKELAEGAREGGLKF